MALTPKTAPLPIAEVYIDESSTAHQYLVLGAVVMPLTETDALTKLFWKARLPELPRAEMKWTKVSQSKLAAYQRFVDIFFSTPRSY